MTSASIFCRQDSLSLVENGMLIANELVRGSEMRQSDSSLTSRKMKDMPRSAVQESELFAIWNNVQQRSIKANCHKGCFFYAYTSRNCTRLNCPIPFCYLRDWLCSQSQMQNFPAAISFVFGCS